MHIEVTTNNMVNRKPLTLKEEILNELGIRELLLEEENKDSCKENSLTLVGTKFILQEGIGANEGAVGKRVETGIVGTEGVTGGQEIFSRAGRRSRELLSMIISKIVRFVSIMVASINMVSSGSQDLNLNQEYWLAPCQGWKEENFALKTDSLFHGRIHSFLPHHITWQFCRLLPVLDVPIFSKNTSADGNSNKGIAAYKHIREVFKLDVILRQTGNSNEQKEFCDILLRMHDGESSLDNWKILST
ncbi:hypothetical protein GLOIN_2v1791357 [Rhizophagus irregularis DAOM 181602=DAOM 197198]|uniref:Uncharacterized protein n=1 Tax=Rhizophagus irregularis (strain DAOM 181602 / DAOM 197198 / MUCL 43194) TaxID=747089 RepID=A0A2P4NXC1_RHIID|nr:hypothetical protein GLOIN_2v1791357 [Rhizophagus irregularis DAOM 181602=DAOM 197198]POG57748.1 hypothetical protein GLOIN_2v1791357 [Rhizophagus irregularis DAOM 181602=DAOM 197198]|eukprot:XP_025164614.1 hypothetical protein GLOIN_2v1791357 [Rhizophagus irregularis DAOM 181602=DAOM 197198]